MKIGVQTWGSEGDIRPFLALAGGLRAKGHDVSLVITSVDNKDYTSYANEPGFRVSHVGRLDYDDATIRRFETRIIKATNPLRQIELIMEYFFDPVIPEMFGAAERLCAENDAIIGHFAHFPVQTAAEKAGKPHATVMLNHLGVYSRYSRISGVPNLGTWMNPLWNRLFQFVIDRSIGVKVNALRKKAGLPLVTRIAESVWISKRLNLIAESSVIGVRQPDWPGYHHVCGAFALPEAAEPWAMPDDLERFMKAGPPPIFMTLGSMFSFDMDPAETTDLLVQGALQAGCRAIVQSRWNELRGFPDHPEIYRIQNAPHQHIFPLCAAVVHHGGAGTTHSATRSGCPSIVIEHIADQGFFAGELHSLGVAPKALHRRSVTAGKLARAIRDVLDDPGMKMRAEALGERMRKENGVRTAVELVEKYLFSCTIL